MKELTGSERKRSEIKKEIGELMNITVKQPFREMMFKLSCNLYGISNVLTLISFIGLEILGQYLMQARGYMTIGGEIWIAIAAYGITSAIRRVALCKGKTDFMCPVPVKRFTQTDAYGEVTIEQDDIQEIILYLAEVEDFLERTGKLEKR